MFATPLADGGMFMFGDATGDTFIGSDQRDVMVGGAGADTFQLRQGGGHDLIVGFNPATDVFHLTLDSGVSERTMAFEETPWGTILHYGNGLGGAAGANSILLFGSKPGELGFNNFSFEQPTPIAGVEDAALV